MHKKLKLICFKQEDTLLYLNTDYNSCFPLTVSIEDDIKKTDYLINIYPNPNNGIFNINIKNICDENISVEIMNITGQVIYSKQFDIKLTKTVKEIDISNYSKGLYFLKVQSKEIIKVEKLIIQ